jgi:hypothetical protein
MAAMTQKIASPSAPPTAIEFGLVEELRMFRNPIVVGGGTPFLSRSPRSSCWS